MGSHGRELYGLALHPSARGWDLSPFPNSQEATKAWGKQDPEQKTSDPERAEPRTFCGEGKSEPT